MMETRPFGEPSNEEPKTVRRTAYDAKNGTSRSATYANPDELTVAAITTGKNPIITTNRYAYWLDGEENPFAEHLFRDLVEAIASYTVVLDEEAQMVNLSVPWKLRGYPDDIGTWSYVLDPRKGFMPVSAKGTWDDRKEDEDPSVPPQRWRIEEFIVTDSKCVGDVWMPLKLREVITASTAEKNVANVYDTTIHEIEHGNVTAQDLIVEFGDKTYVADETKSVEYVADSNGKPREGTLKPLYTKAPAPPATKPGTFSFLIGTNIVAIALFVIFKVVAQRRKRERSVDTP